MFRFFDFLYLTFYDLFSKEDGKEPEFEASVFLAGFQCLNSLSLLMIYRVLFERTNKANISAFLAILIFILCIVLNYIRYLQLKKFYYKEIRARWESKTNSSRQTTKNWQLLYLAVSVVVFGYLIYFFASKVVG